MDVQIRIWDGYGYRVGDGDRMLGSGNDMATVQRGELCWYFLFIGTAQPGKPRLMPAVVLWLADDAPKPTRRGCSHLLTDGGEKWEGRGDAGGGRGGKRGGQGPAVPVVLPPGSGFTGVA